MLSFRTVFSFMIFLALSLPVLAEDKKDEKQTLNVETAPVTDPVKTAAPNTIDKADQLITNRRLRADSGSLSTWSVSSSWNYQGGSLAFPKEPQRPNIVKGADALQLQNLTGDIGVRHRFTKLFSLTASTGVFWTTPFHDTIKTKDPKLKENFDENHQKLTVNDPLLKATYLNKFAFLQMVTNFKGTLVTNNQQKLDGYRWSYYLSQQFMHNIEGTKFSYGGNIALQFYTFSKENPALTDQVFGVYPAVEYEISDKVMFRTAFGQWVYQHLRNQDNWTYEKRKVYQSVGFGILLSRDVFLYPNIQYIPSDIRSDRTNIALSTNINFF